MPTMTKKVAALPEVTGYDTGLSFYATRFTQGGRTVYSLDLSPLQVKALIPKPNPDTPTPGNRRIRLSHAADFAKYLREQSGWIIPAMIFRTAHPFGFEVVSEVAGSEFGVLTIPRQSASDIRILDGQHRTLGIYLADEAIAADLDKARSFRASAKRQDPSGAAVKEADQQIRALERQRERLNGERVVIQLFVEADTSEYKQMFFDIADNALGISASVKARFDARKVVNRALEPVLEHPLLANRVDMEADRLGRGTPYLLTAKHVTEIIKSVLVGLDGRVGRRMEKETHESEVVMKTGRFFDTMLASFPPLEAVLHGQVTPEGLRKTSLLGSPLMWRVLAGVHHDLIEQHSYSEAMVGDYFSVLAQHMPGPLHANSIWAAQLPEGIVPTGGTSPSGRRQDSTLLNDKLVKWAILREPFVTAPPEAAPLPPTEEVSTEEEARVVDEILAQSKKKAAKAAKL